MTFVNLDDTTREDVNALMEQFTAVGIPHLTNVRMVVDSYYTGRKVVAAYGNNPMTVVHVNDDSISVEFPGGYGHCSLTVTNSEPSQRRKRKPKQDKPWYRRFE